MIGRQNSSFEQLCAVWRRFTLLSGTEAGKDILIQVSSNESEYTHSTQPFGERWVRLKAEHGELREFVEMTKEIDIDIQEFDPKRVLRHIKLLAVHMKSIKLFFAYLFSQII